MSIKNKYIVLGLMGAMMSFAQEPFRDELKTFNPPKEPKKIIPKGCKEFKFYYGNGQVYECIATSKKSADKKFKNFLNRNVGL